MTYGWQMGELTSESERLENSQQDFAKKDVYQEMILDYSQEKRNIENVNRAQFKRAITHFNFTEYQNELELILYFEKLLSDFELSDLLPNLDQYSEEDVVNLAKIYMRRKEPNDYPYFRKIVTCQERIQFCYLAPKNSFLGKSYFLDRNHYYILINSINGIQDAVTLLHESSHVENYLKYGLNLSKYYAELAPMTREHYSFDMLSIYDERDEVEKQRALSLNHYLTKIRKLCNGVNLLFNLKRNQGNLKQILSDFDSFSTYVDVNYLHELLSSSLESEIGYALSFIASLDIYSNCTPQESNLFITGYQIGTRNVSRKIVDRVVPFLLSTLKPYQKVKN